jgi:DNA-binding transcriptional ArsR family regulator
MSTPDTESPDLRALNSIDRLIHEPARLQIVSWLSVLEEADFIFLLQQTGQTRGNLSSHISKLETAGYVEVNKAFIGKVPRTVYKLTAPGREAFEAYRRELLATLEAL